MTSSIARQQNDSAPPAEKRRESHDTDSRPNQKLISEASAGMREKNNEGDEKGKRINFGPPDMSRFVPDTELETLVPGKDGKPLKLRVVGENNSFIERDEEKRIKSIDYGNVHKLREFGYDGKELNSIKTTETKDGKSTTTTLTKDKENNKWYTEVNGSRFYLQGNIELRDNGDFAIQDKEGGPWRTERRNGTTFIEKVNASGTRVAFNEDKTISHISRTDGSTVDCSYKDGKLNQVTESPKDGAAVTWTRSGEAWHSNEKPPKERKNFNVNENGNIDWQNADGTKTIIRGDGIKVNESANGQQYEFDKEGRLTKMTYGGGKMREFTYAEGTDRVQSYKETNPKEPDKTRTFTRQGDTDEWLCTDAKGAKVGSGVWKGELKTTSEGGWAWKQHEQPGRAADGSWHKVDSNGVETIHKIGQDGSALMYDEKGNLLRLQRPNGTGVEVTYENGQKSKVAEFNLNTQRETVWSYDANTKKWTSEDKTQADSTECPIGNDGNYKFKSVDGSRHTVKPDGAAELNKPDGSKVSVDADGLVRQVTAKNGSTRTFDYEGHDLVRVTDTTKAGTAVWDKKTDAKSRTNVCVSELGDVSYTDENLAKVIDRTDFSRSKFNAQGQLELVMNQDGSSRRFTYDEQSHNLKSVTDTRTNAKGQQTQTWDAQVTADGAVSLSLKNGEKTEVRRNVKIDEYGDYTYTGSDNKEHTAKTSGRFRDSNSKFYSDAIADGHADYLEKLTGSMNEQDLARMERMMNEFEKRQADLNELRSEKFKADIERKQMDDSTRQRLTQENDERLAADLDKRVADTYKQLGELVSAPNSPEQYYDQKQRVKLAENFMYHAADPTTMNQGNTGTCWIMSSHVAGGMVGHTDSMARLLKEVSLTGNYTALHAGLNDDHQKTFHFSKNLVAIRHGDYGADWTPESAQNSSVRSAVGMIFDQVLPVIGGRREGHSNAGGYSGGSDGSKNIMYMVTGDVLQYGNDGVGAREKDYLLQNGAFVSSGHGHMWGYLIEKNGNQWQIVRNDQYQGRDRVVAQFDNLRDFIQRDLADRRPRRPVRLAMNFDQPGNTDTPITPSQPDPNRPRYTTNDDDNVDEERPIRRFIRRRWR